MESEGLALLAHHSLFSPFTMRIQEVERAAKQRGILTEKTVPVTYRAKILWYVNSLLIDTNR